MPEAFPIIAPSILSADFSTFKEELKRLENSGANWIHVDVMDGVFVPNLTFGAPIIKGIRPHTELPFDVHLMVERPLELMDDYIAAGANSITIHAESDLQGRTLAEAVQEIKEKDVSVGVSLKPATPVYVLKEAIHLVDIALIMTVEPGFGGQSFMEDQLSKIVQLKGMSEKSNPDLIIQVDGGIKESTIRKCANAGATCFVAGSAILAEPRTTEHYQSNIEKLQLACK